MWVQYNLALSVCLIALSQTSQRVKMFYNCISGSLDGGRPVPDDVRPLGIYLTFDVREITEPPSVVEPTSASTSSARAFSVLMANANRNLKRLPNKLSETDNLRKPKNKFREFLALNNVGWSADCVSKYGPSFINTVSDCMWYIDEHHESLSRQVCGVPVGLRHLQNYNKPELHGHKRKGWVVLCKETLRQYVISLNSALAHAYMQSESWRCIRSILEKLSTQLSKYETYLEKKNEQAAEHHTRTSLSTDDDNMEVMEAKRSLNCCNVISITVVFFTQVVHHLSMVTTPPPPLQHFVLRW